MTEPPPPEPPPLEPPAPAPPDQGVEALPPEPARPPAPRPSPAPRPAPLPEPIDDVDARRQSLFGSWQALQRRYRTLVERHGEERVGAIVAQLIEAASTSVDRFIDHPEEYDKLGAQLEALSDLVKEREDALR